MIIAASVRRVSAALALLCAGAPGHAATEPAARVALTGSVAAVPLQPGPGRPHLVRSVLTDAELAAPIDFAISLRMRNFSELQGRIHSAGAVNAAELEARYLPAADDFVRVEAWLQSQGLTLGWNDRNHTTVFARGTVAQVSAVFGVPFARVATADGEFSSAVGDPAIPRDLAASILAIVGLQPHRRFHCAPLHAAVGILDGPNVTPGPGDISAAYNVPTNLTGAGQTIAIIMSGVPTLADLTQFWTLAGVNQSPGNFSVINVAGGGGNGTAETGEAALDVEWASGMAPGAAVRLYAIPSLIDVDILQALSQIASDTGQVAGLDVLSLSFGGNEGDLSNTPSVLQSYSQAYAQLAALGVTVLACAGDGGSNPYEVTDPSTYFAGAAEQVQYPPSDPNVTGVGGTTLSFRFDGTEQTETTWFALTSEGFYGTGGGVSQFFSRPAWQTGPGLPSTSFRCVPDVAAQAGTGLLVVGGQLDIVFGTSLATPIWAGIVALINQARAQNGLGPVGLLASQVYALIDTPAFNDITTGGNGGFSAGAGYDLCTGVGTPNVANLASALATPAPTAPSIVAPPVSQTVAANATVPFTVTAAGTAPAYQWNFNGAAIAGATNPTLILLNATAAAAGAYSVTVSNSAGSITSAPATLNVSAGSPPLYVFSPLAGSPAPIDHSDGAGAAARLLYPRFPALDAGGNLYFTDTNADVVRKMDPTGLVTTLAGAFGQAGSTDGPGAVARFDHPKGLAIDASGNLYVSDTDNETIRKITPDGTVSTLAGAVGQRGSADGTGSAARFDNPEGMAIDPAGNLYLADYFNEAIRKITPAGAVSTLAGAPGLYGATDATGYAARFDGPTGVALDPSTGNLYVADSFSDIIRVVTPQGVVTTLAGSAGSPGSNNGAGKAARFNTPYALAVDSAGNIDVSELTNSTIRQITRQGVVTTLAGKAGVLGFSDGQGSAAEFYGPAGIAIDANSNLYVCDLANHRIRKIAPGAVVTTLAGATGTAGSADGIGAAAGFSYPSGLVLDGSGNAYVADSINNTIRRVAPDGATTTFAGTAGASGSLDGSGAAASFDGPNGLAIDTAGNLYVADSNNDTIRKITPAGVVSTLAGQAGRTGTSDGTGTAARFNGPTGVAVDASGNVYVTDTGNDTVREITPAGAVTTLAGQAGTGGVADGQGTEATFDGPEGIAVDSSGNVVVADSVFGTIREIAPTGAVTTLAGSEDLYGSSDGQGPLARFNAPTALALDGSGNLYVSDVSNANIRKVSPGGAVTTLGGPGALFYAAAGIAVDHLGNLYVADSENNEILKGVPGMPSFTVQPLPLSIAAGATAVLTAAAYASPTVAYQWYLNGVAVSGATAARLVIPGASAASAGAYTCVATNLYGTSTSSSASLSVSATTNPGRLINLAILSDIQNSLSMGFVSGGTGTSGLEPMLIRAVGPSIGPGSVFGVPGVIIDPTLNVIQQTGAIVVAQNAGWGSNQAAVTAADTATGAFALANSASLDSAVVANLPESPGGYSATVAGASGDSGWALTEVYDATANYTPASPRLINLSCLTQIVPGGSLSVGFVIGGATAKTVLVRVGGPVLNTLFGIGSAMMDPQLQLSPLSSASSVLAANTGWGGDPQIAGLAATVGAYSFPNPNSLDSAAVITLAPGAYTVGVSSASGAGGTVLVEIYDVP